VTLRFVLFAVAAGIAVAGSVWANDEVRGVQEKLRDGGFYSGEIDGAYSSDLNAAVTRYQIRNGLPITGQLDADTSKALGTKPAVTNSAADTEQSSETWRRLRRGKHKTSAEARKTSSPSTAETEKSTETQPRSAPAVRPAAARTARETTESASAPPPAGSERRRPVSAPPATERTSSETTESVSVAQNAVATSSDDGGISTERLRDYVGAFVLAGLDPHVGSEADFFADRVKYYDQGVIDREKIRNDLQDYAARWPERHFSFAGNITIEPQQLILIIGIPQHRKRVRVTFPLRYELRNGATYSSGTINKTLVLEPVGDDLQIIAVSESKAE
jgi:peptidoglycan hydrolase-like protein with peptidoglycan-binding domain